MAYNSFMCLISISHNAIFIRIAAIMGYGKYINPSLKKMIENTRVKNPMRKGASLLFHPDSILSEVRTNTAVTGIQPKSHEAILAIPRPKTSFCFEYLSLVIDCAI